MDMEHTSDMHTVAVGYLQALVLSLMLSSSTCHSIVAPPTYNCRVSAYRYCSIFCVEQCSWGLQQGFLQLIQNMAQSWQDQTVYFNHGVALLWCRRPWQDQTIYLNHGAVLQSVQPFQRLLILGAQLRTVMGWGEIWSLENAELPVLCKPGPLQC